MSLSVTAPRVCLSMIVKNEAHVIARCLASVRPFLSAFVVVDTGSTDGTQALVRQVMGDLPGEVVDRPWRDFATNRNEALALAAALSAGKADYLLVIDADDTLVHAPDYALPPLVVDAYQLMVEDHGTSYLRTHLFRADRGFAYVGVLHEVLIGPAGHSIGRLPGLTYHRASDGARSADPDKFRKDAAVLEAACAREPENARYVFYLAQSLRDAGELEKALEAYERRATMGGWAEEVWFSLYEMGRLLGRLGRPDDEVIAAYLLAFEIRPARAESLCQLAALLRERGRRVGAYPFAKAASEIPRPDDILFLDEGVYAWRALDELAIAAYWAGRHEESRALCERLLSGSALPAGEAPRVRKNLEFALEKLGKAG
jgi:glycosyltransferase involved in cell wall biosynthesis